MIFRRTAGFLIILLAFHHGQAFAVTTGRAGAATVLMPNGDFMIIGGVIAPTAIIKTSTTEIFFTSATAWGAGPSMNAVRSSHTATLLSDGRVLVAGGFNTAGVPLQSAELYNPVTKTWTLMNTAVDCTGRMCLPRGGHTATVISRGANKGKVLICGGQFSAAGVDISSTCETFDPYGASPGVFGWAAMMSSPRIGHTASATNKGTVFVSGGKAWNTSVTPSTWVYLPTNELYDGSLTWTPVTSLNQGRAYHVATVLNNGNIMIAGGYAGSAAAANLCYLPEESWHDSDEGSDQNACSHGYLGSAELFDPNGGRVQISGKDTLTMPYRVANAAALLMTDGTNHIQGGYGNIPPKFVTNSQKLEKDITLDVLSPVITADEAYATVDPASQLKFALITSLPRTVDGRIVDGDFFISPASGGGNPWAAQEEDRGQPALTSGNMKVWLARSTAPLDGSPVGVVKESGKPGEFNDIVWPRDLIGRVDFAAQTVTSENGTISGSNVVYTDIAPTESGYLGGAATITVPIKFTVPSIYIGGTIVGSATINSATISPLSTKWSLSLTGGVGDIGSLAVPVDITESQGSGLVDTSITFRNFGTGAKLLNNTTWQTLSTTAGGSDVLQLATFNNEEMISISLKVSYVVNQVDLSGLTYSMTTSTFVIRGMLFADHLVYAPKDSSWAFGEPLTVPMLEHNLFLTPAADMLLLGGKNCEDPDDDTYPYNNCTRASQSYLANATDSATIGANRTEWPAYAKLSTKRAFHTSTLLPSGDILTCGGSDGAATLSGCEVLYATPTAKSQPGWTAASSMTYTRARHTATLLPDGNVLVTGGTTGASTAAISTSETYYPASKRWVSTAQTMNIPRQNHTATLLPDGNVLVAGGSSTGTYTNTAEIYIATAAVWRSVGDMPSGRSQHTATLLKNGKVLVAGGVNGMGPLKATAIYDPATRTWTAGPDMQAGRYSHTATLLKDGRVIVIGGSDNFLSLLTAELYNGVSWNYVESNGETALMSLNRANHRTVLLPNGKLMITGGESAGVSQGTADGFDVDMSSFQPQGKMQSRANHTSLLTYNNYILNIGGWDGSKYLDSTDILYFANTPDMQGLDPKTRNPAISTGTSYFDRGDQITLQSGATNFHGMTEASGGGAGPANSSFSNPRIYLQSIDNPSGFLTDLTTRFYTIYGSTNSDWEATLSSITITMSSAPAEVPYGWYHVRVAANGQFSEGYTVQATVPRPAGHIINLQGTVLGSTSVYWTWTADTEMNANNPLPDGFGIFASSNSVFLTTVSFTSPNFIQTGLAPNTSISIKVGAYNTGGYGELAVSSTIYTWAVTPQDLTVQRASFETAMLSWNPADNSAETPYEVTMWDDDAPDTIFTPVPFTNNYTSTFTTITSLSPNKYYDFRVRAKNGAGIMTAYSNVVTTITIDSITNLGGTALSVSQINWGWDASEGDPNYEIYALTGPQPNDIVFLGSSTVASFTQTEVSGTALSTNTAYAVRVNAYKNYYGPVRGPYALGKPVYTLAAVPLPGVPAVFTSVTTGSAVINWIANGNPSSTSYTLDGSKEAVPPSTKISTFTMTTMGASTSLSKLLPNTSYSMMISAQNGDGVLTDAVNLGSFHTLAQPPARVRPSAITMSGVTLEWDPVGNPLSTIYEIRGSTVSLLTGPFMSPAPLAFSQQYTSNTYSISGLLTSTTYYFDVAARNQELVVTGRTQCVPAAYTLAGPDSAPPGSVGGTSDPSKDVTISGTLPNNRYVSVNIPAGAFATQTAVAISSWSGGSPFITNPCGYQIGTPVHPLEVAIFSMNGVQPQVPLTLTLKYDGESAGETHESTKIGLDYSKLVLARYNALTGQCLPLETRIDTGLRTITATLDHFSVFQLMMKNPAANLSAVRVYPNPLYINGGPNLLTIDNMPASAKVRIYTLSGDKVWEGTASTTGDIHWRGVNSSGITVGSGIYLAVIDSTAGKKVVKIAVER